MSVSVFTVTPTPFFALEFWNMKSCQRFDSSTNYEIVGYELYGNWCFSFENITSRRLFKNRLYQYGIKWILYYAIDLTW